ncbi:MAG: rod shape-determining protein RodA [Parcubacteria group bacterium RIFOXYD2_FULL_52_8]|nr:MAG: rod shape-determining protein RodA [Parcubacteria group bacterium RIFOXYD2_FULL_52_8]
MSFFRTSVAALDWLLLGSTLPLLLAGWLTMNSFGAENYFADRQLLWIGVAILVFFLCSQVDWRFLKRPWILFGLYLVANAFLVLLFVGAQIKGTQSWFHLGSIAVEPGDFVNLLVVILLAKYFSRRHVEIANIRHVLISGIYALIPFVLVLLQPNFGSAIVIVFIWLGMVLVSGIPKKYLFAVLGAGLVAFCLLWLFVFKPYQKNRILNFVDPMRDVRGSGYNAFQSQIAVGSGQLVGKGVGNGTQSRLQFLPEYQTDFIVAAFAEEWGFVGVLIIFVSFAIIIWRALTIAYLGASNFEMLYGMGFVMLLVSHFVINVGMNVGLLPVTGITVPFMSYGGSHLLVEFIGLGILMSMRRYARAAHRDDMKNEFLGI